MAIPELTAGTPRLPNGYVAVPISEAQLVAPVKVCVVAAREPDPVGGSLVLLRDLLDARVYLGCLVDAATRVLRWLEIWVQDLDKFVGVTKASSVGREALSNAVLDERWQAQHQYLAEAGPWAAIHTGWESENPPPTLLDVQRGVPVHPKGGPDDLPWELCKEDAVLSGRGLPQYSVTLDRYLYQRERGLDSQFIAVTTGSPSNEHTVEMERLLPKGGKLVPLNLGGGLLMVRGRSPLGLDEFIDLLGGSAWTGVIHGKSRLRLGALAEDGDGAAPGLTSGGHLFMGLHGRSGRMAETFHLKARLLSDVVDSVGKLIKRTQRPLLNVRPESFEVELQAPGRGVPVLWTTRVGLIDPGDAISLRVPSGDTKYYLPGKSMGLSVYLPAVVAQISRGTGQFMIRRMQPSVGGMTVLEGTFATSQQVVAAKNDMVYLRVPLAGERVDLYAKLEQQSNLAYGELRFRTVGQRFAENVLRALRDAEGVPLPQVPFEILPLLSSPCDLYSLGVLAVKIFVVNPQTTLAEAMGNVIAMARQLGRERTAEHAAGKPLPKRIQELFARDPRFKELLGPHRMVHQEIKPAEALEFIPEEMWWDLLAMIVRMFPGYGGDSRCEDFGDAPPGGIHRVFDDVLTALDSLLTRSRSLLMIDWKYNREVHSVLRKLRGNAGATAGAH
jgi:hypothetical protein